MTLSKRRIVFGITSLAPLALIAFTAAGCIAPTDADVDELQTPSEAAFTAEGVRGAAFFTYRITGDVTPSPSASSIANDASRNMDGAGNQCMVPLQRGEGYDDLRAAGVHFPTLDGIAGLPLGSLCNVCVDLTLGSVTQRVRLVDSLRDGQDVYEAARGVHFDLHASTYQAFQAVASSPNDIRGATYSIVRCGEAPLERRYGVRHFAGGNWFQLQARHADIPVRTMELVEGGGRVIAAASEDHTGFFTFYAQEGTRYAVRLNGAEVHDVLKLPTATTDTESRANGQWSAAVVKGEVQSLQAQAPAPNPPPPSGNGGGGTTCTDAPPPAASGQASYSCAEQKGFGKCGESWMQGYCASTCKTCQLASAPAAACTDGPPPAAAGQPQYSCGDQQKFGKCGESWMKGYCGSTCKTCQVNASAPTCSDGPPPASAGEPQYSCAQQSGYGKCGESWMRGYCKSTCNACP